MCVCVCVCLCDGERERIKNSSGQENFATTHFEFLDSKKKKTPFHFWVSKHFFAAMGLNQ